MPLTIPTLPADTPHPVRQTVQLMSEAIDRLEAQLAEAQAALRATIGRVQAVEDQPISATTITPTAIVGENDLLVGDGTNEVGIIPFNSAQTLALTNEASSPAAPRWNQINLANGVKNRLPYANIITVPETRLLGRGQGAGTGNQEVITLGAGLTMNGTELTSVGAGGGQYRQFVVEIDESVSPDEWGFLSEEIDGVILPVMALFDLE